MKSVEGVGRTVGIGLASAMLLLSFVGVLAVPAFAAGSDPSYFIDCSTHASAGPGTWNLVEGISPSTQTTCPAGGLTASGTAVTAFTDGSVSNGVVYIDSTTAISGTYTMVDCGTSSSCTSPVTIASGTFSGAGKSNTCSGTNALTFTGSGNNGAVINTGDILELTLTMSSSSVSFCSGGSGTVLTPTAVNVEAAVPEFGAAIAAVALAFVALRVVRKKGTTSLGPMTASV